MAADNTVTLVCPDCNAKMSVQTDQREIKKRRCWRCRAVMSQVKDSAAKSEAIVSRLDESSSPPAAEQFALETVECADADLDQADQATELLSGTFADEDHALEMGLADQDFSSAKAAMNEISKRLPSIHEFQFECPICHTLIPASTLQIGDLLTCVDCESSIRVHPPAVAALRPIGTFFQTDATGNREAESEYRIGDPIELPKFQLPDIDLLGEEDSLWSALRRQADSTFHRSAGRDLLRPVSANEGSKAASFSTPPATSPPATTKPQSSGNTRADADRATAARPAEQQPEATRLEIRSLGEFLAFIAHPEFIFRWIALSLVLIAELLLVHWTISSLASTDLATRIVGYPLIFPSILIGVIYIVISFVFGANVLERTSAGQRTIDQWPEFDFFGWLSRSFYFLTSFWLSTLPGLLLSLLFVSYSFWYWIAAPFLAISFFIFFPVLLFSVICNQQAWNPVSQPVFDSFKTCRGSWQQFYAYSALILLASAPLALLPLLPGFSSPIVATAFVFLSFAYFRLLGYLGRNLSKQMDILN